MSAAPLDGPPLETPEDEAALSVLVADAAASGRRLEIVGGGSRRGLGGPVAADAALSTAGLTGVRLYEPEALTLVAGAGTPLAEIEALLAAEGQRLPFEPIDHRALLGAGGAPTLGGVVATNASGPRRIQAGACRDSLIGLRFVDGTGRIVKNGGRVMKNVTGYDLVKLMAGAHGTLGVLTECAFKLLPLPEASRTLLIEGLDEATAARALSAALGSPYDVTAAAHVPGSPPRTLLRIEGFVTAMTHRGARLRELLAEFGDARIVEDADETAALWAAIRDATPAADAEGAVWRCSVRPTDGPVLAERLRAAEAAETRLFDWGGGLVWAVAPANGDCGVEAVRRETAALGGHATLIRAPEAVRAATPPFHPEPAPLARLSAALRAKFDPAGVLNPGRMTPA